MRAILPLSTFLILLIATHILATTYFLAPWDTENAHDACTLWCFLPHTAKGHLEVVTVDVQYSVDDISSHTMILTGHFIRYNLPGPGSGRLWCLVQQQNIPHTITSPQSRMEPCFHDVYANFDPTI